ncbi:hypothetical protein DAPPPG215_23210 [Pseudomonas syringae pv. tomato]|uniref:Transposase n=1 Tax=Pseudomonas syringae pv. tomato TaxID=323 RepID=A0AAV1BQC0_PSEUB|nr:hypothetical protein DAPPPG215_23210 [Pseudomonas syringae pv. tomato]
MMRPDAKVEKVYLYPNPMDFLKSIDGLAALVELDISTRKTLTSCPGSVDHYNPGPSNRRRIRPKASFSPRLPTHATTPISNEHLETPPPQPH